MTDCASCKKSVESGDTHICRTEHGNFVISNWPTQGEKCKEYAEKPTIILKQRFRLKLQKEQKKQTIPNTTPQATEPTVSFKNGLGWIIAAVLAGVIIGMQLFGA